MIQSEVVVSLMTMNILDMIRSMVNVAVSPNIVKCRTKENLGVSTVAMLTANEKFGYLDGKNFKLGHVRKTTLGCRS